MDLIEFGGFVASSIRRTAFAFTAAVWLASGALFLLPRLVEMRAIEPRLLLIVGLATTYGMAFSAPVYFVASVVRRWSPSRRFGALLLTAMVAGAGIAALDTLVGVWAAGAAFSRSAWLQAAGNYGGFTSLCGLLAGIYSVLIQQEEIKAREREIAEARLAETEARAVASTARLEALRYQLNPHFLFNTLNAISSRVVTGRSDEAERMLERLSDFLRTTLASEGGDIVTLEAELEMLQAYLEIEGVRFGDRLGVEFACPASLMSCRVPGFILQPLVENAVKYGVAPTSRRVRLRIEAERGGDGGVILSVSDDGDGSAASAPSAGIGLRNVRERLRVYYGDDASLDAAATAQGYRARIRLPETACAS